MNLFRNLWRDEEGYILSAEAALLGTMAVVGASVGLSAVSKAVNDELTELAYAFRSLDQSYCISGNASCGAWTAGSHYIQPDVENSRAELGQWIDEQQAVRESETDEVDKAPPWPDGDRRREFEKRRRRHQDQMRNHRDQKKSERHPTGRKTQRKQD